MSTYTTRTASGLWWVGALLSKTPFRRAWVVCPVAYGRGWPGLQNLCSTWPFLFFSSCPRPVIRCRSDHKNSQIRRSLALLGRAKFVRYHIGFSVGLSAAVRFFLFLGVVSQCCFLVVRPTLERTRFLVRYLIERLFVEQRFIYAARHCRPSSLFGLTERIHQDSNARQNSNSYEVVC